MVDFGYIYEIDNCIKEIIPGVTVERRGRRLVFLKDRKTSQEIILYPEFCSWGGFNGWCKTIQDNFGELSSDEIYLALIYPELEFNWLFQLSDKTKHILTGIVTPFNNTVLDIEAILYWEKNKCENICSLIEICTWKLGKVLCWAKPKNRWEFNHARCMMFVEYNSENKNLKMYQVIQGSKRSRLELKIFGVFGKISPKLVKIVYENKNQGIDIAIDVAKLVDKYFPEFNISFWDGGHSFKSMMNAGCKVTKLLPKQMSKKQKHRIVSKILEKSIIDFEKYNEPLIRILCQDSDIPESWTSEIFSYEIFLWAEKHIPQLSKSRIIHGPGGAVQTMHYHSLLREVTPWMVPSPKTAWRKVMGRLEKKAKKKIEAELGNNVPLPVIKHPRVKGATPISSSHLLKVEGEKMNHCVGGYVTACLAKTSYIYHLGAPSPQGSTLEVCKGGHKWKGMQHYGLDDKTPSHELNKIKSRLISVLNS